jgi:hypothetical protein
MRKLFYLGFVIILFASCEKDDSNSINDSVEKTNYFPLGIGNYWIYKHYDIDSLGNETERDRIDSVIINRDTIINNNQYFILEGTNYPFNGESWGIVDILRDSSGYVVNEKGKIKFSSENFTDTLASEIEVINEDTLYILTYRMEKLTNHAVVPAGEFEALNYKGTVITSNPSQGVKNPRYMNNYFANNVGKILETYFFLSSPIIGERRLVRYKIKDE